MRTHSLLDTFFVLALCSGWLDVAEASTRSGRAARPMNPIISPERRRIGNALQKVFPVVSFEKADLEQVVAFLSQEAEVNIVIDPAVYALVVDQSGPYAATPDKPIPLSAPPPSSEAESGHAPPRRAAPGSEAGRITIRLKNVPLKTVLKYVLRFKNLRYIVDEYAIVIVPVGWVPREQLVTRVFRLSNTTAISAASM